MVYTATSIADLVEIGDYLRQRNLKAAEDVAAALSRSIERLAFHPFMGRAQTREHVRKLVEPRFGYVVYYELDTSHGVIFILTILHSARRRPFDDA